MKLFKSKPPKTDIDNVINIPHLEELLLWFLENDRFFINLNRELTKKFFKQGNGIDTTSDVYHIFEKEPRENKSIYRYLVILLWRDVVSVIESMKEAGSTGRLAKTFFIDKIEEIGKESDNTIQEVFQIAEKNNTDPVNINEEQIDKFNVLDQARFKNSYVKDVLLSCEVRLLSWIYKDLFGEEFKFENS